MYFYRTCNGGQNTNTYFYVPDQSRSEKWYDTKNNNKNWDTDLKKTIKT